MSQCLFERDFHQPAAPDDEQSEVCCTVLDTGAMTCLIRIREQPAVTPGQSQETAQREVRQVDARLLSVFGHMPALVLCDPRDQTRTPRRPGQFMQHPG